MCPFVYCCFALFVLGGLILCALEVMLSLALMSFPPFPNYSNVHVDLANKSVL